MGDLRIRLASPFLERSGGMPGERLPMRKIIDVLRLHAEGLSKRKIAESLTIGATSAGDCVRRAKRAGLSWPLPENLDEDALERLLYPPPTATAAHLRPQPDWAAVHRELRRPGVTLQLLWEEYRSTYPDRESLRRASTSRASTARTRIWRLTMARRLFRRAPKSHAIKLRPKLACRWRLAGLSPSCAIGVSSR